MAERAVPPIRRHVFGVIAAAMLVFCALLVPLPAQAATSVTVPDAIARILSDTNALRAAGGLAPLTESTAMDTVAQNWSAAMYAAGSLTHNPNYSTQIPSGWTTAGENIATGYSYTTVVEAWHQSAGHYANIMGNYNAIGIGYYEANGKTYFTQDFGKYSTVPSAKAAATSGAPTPVVSGHTILDSRTGQALTIHAVNWPSFEYACQQGWGNSADGATAAAANAMVAWGINAVRVPLNQDCWLGVDGAPRSPITVAGYRSALTTWVSTLNAAGLIVILDLHWTAPAGSTADGQRAMPDAQSPTFWTSVATTFKDSKSVMFETFNEPYSRGTTTVSWSCWLNGGCQVPVANDQSPIGTTTYTAVGQAALVAAIRATGATQPILLDGLNYANDVTGWLANKPNDTQLIASWHNYPGQGCSDTTCWNSQVLPLAATVPVVTTEFGETDGGSSFMTAFMAWADAHGIGYAPWAWWVTDSSDGTAANLYSLISDLSTFAPRAPEGTAFHDHLAALGIAPSGNSAAARIAAVYAAAGGPTGSLGAPTSNLLTINANGGGTAQTFVNGTIYSSTAGTYIVAGRFRDYFYARSGPNTTVLGWPTSNATTCTPTTTCTQSFQYSNIYLAGSTSWNTTPAIEAVYAAAGGPTGSLGAPTSNLLTINANGGGTAQTFVNGTIYSSTAGTYIVAGRFRDYFYARSGPNTTVLGWPTSNATTCTPTTTCTQSFQYSNIYLAGSTSWNTTPAIEAVYAAAGGPTGSLGAPTSNLLTINANGGGTAQTFVNGTIYSSTAGTYIVAGRFRDYFYARSGPNTTVLGWPTSNATTCTPTTTCTQSFQYSNIYLAGSTSWNTTPAIEAVYAAAGGPTGSLGAPTSNLLTINANGGGTAQTFVNGTIYSSTAGTYIVAGRFRDYFYARSGPNTTVLGWPTSNATTCTPTTTCTQSFQYGNIVFGPS